MPLQTPDEPKKYTTVYSDFRGVDYTNNEINVWKRRSPTGLNMIPDEAGRPWKRTGWDIAVSVNDFQEVYNQVFPYVSIIDRFDIKEVHSVTIAGKDHMIINTSVGVFDYTNNGLKLVIVLGMDQGRSFYFEAGAIEGFYMFRRYEMYKYDGENIKKIEPYTPVVLISRQPSGGGTLFEPVNVINNRRTESFLGDSESLEYYVSSTILGNVKVEVMNAEGIFEELTDGYTIETTRIIFEEAKPPVKSGEDNVKITYDTSTNISTVDVYDVIRIKDEDYIRDYQFVSKRFKLEANNVVYDESGNAKVEIYRITDDYNYTLSSNDYTVATESDGSTYVTIQALCADYPLLFDGFETYLDIKVTLYGDSRNPDSIAFGKCRTCAIYGTGIINSVFMSASTSAGYESRVWYSKVEQPTYFPDTNYFEAGSNDTSIMGLAKIGEYLGVIKQGDTIDSTIYIAYPITFEDDTAYAVKQSVNGVGAVSINGFNNLGDELLFLSKDGIMAVDASENEKQVKNRSYYLNKKLVAEPNLELAVSHVWNDFYFLSVNSHCYILDGSQKTSWANERTNLQYECYYWENIDAKCFAHYSDSLWFADRQGNMCRMKKYEEDGILAYNDNGEAIPCEWSTILDNDGATNYFKNLQKKGCLVTLLPLPQTGAEVYVRADGKEPELIGEISAENPTVPIEFYLNKKVKKYKRLQIIVKNDNVNQGFGLQEIIKVYTVGNYSKNRA